MKEMLMKEYFFIGYVIKKGSSLLQGVFEIRNLAGIKNKQKQIPQTCGISMDNKNIQFCQTVLLHCINSPLTRQG